MALPDLQRTNVIYAGGKPIEYLLRGEGIAGIAFLPGTFVYLGGTGYVPLPDSSSGLQAEIADKAYLSVGHIGDEYAANDHVVTFLPETNEFFNVRAEAGTYTKGQALSVLNGVVRVSSSRDGNVGFVHETTTVKADGDLLRILIA